MTKFKYTQEVIDRMGEKNFIKHGTHVGAERIGRFGQHTRIVWTINGNRCSRKDAEKMLDPDFFYSNAKYANA